MSEGSCATSVGQPHMSELLYAGKVKQVWSTEDPDIIEFRYTDQISVFDQIIPRSSQGKESPSTVPPFTG